MQPKEEPSRCVSSCDVPPLNFNAKELDLRRMNRMDTRYTMYRWDCGNYPYYKVPIPVNAPSSSGVPLSYPGSLLAFPGGLPHPAADACCSASGSCHQEGHDFFPQPERCICDPHDPRYLPHPNPKVVHWESIPAGCPCCGQLAVHHPLGPSSHPRHVEPAILYAAPICSALPDGVLAYQGHQESTDEKRSNAPVHCLPDSPETSANKSQRLGSIVPPTEETTRCDYSSPNPNTLHAEKAETSELMLVPEASQPREKQTEKKTLESKSFDDKELKSEDPSGSMTIVELSSSAEETTEKPSPARKVTSASPILQSGQNPGSKVTPRHSMTSSQVTPLYGRPSWWGDEPEQEASHQWKYSPLAASSSCSPSSSSSSSFPIVQNQKRKSDSVVANALLAKATIGSSSSDDRAPSTQRPSEVAVKGSSGGSDDANTKSTDQRFSEVFKQNGHLSVSSASAIAGIYVDGVGNVSSCGAKNPGHSPPERDSGGETQRFVYPDPPSCSQPGRGDRRLAQPSEPDSDSHRRRAATAFTVDLEHGRVNVAGAHRITVETRLSELLPRRCERSLQKRLLWMKRMHQRRRPMANQSDRGEIESTETAIADRAAAQATRRRRFKSKDAQPLPTDDVIANDAIADDVSDAGTYTIDVSSDGESMGIFDARERILAEFGINEITDAELNVGEWCCSTQSVASSENVPNNFELLNSERFRTKLNELMQPSPKGVAREESKSDEDTDKDPGTPTAINSHSGISVIENDDQNVVSPFTKPSCSGSVDQEKLASKSTQISECSVPREAEVVVLTLYTDSAPGGAASSRVEGREMGDNFRKNAKNSARSVRSLDTAVLLAEDDTRLDSHLTCETWRSQASVDTRILLQDPEVFSYDYSYQEKSGHSGSAKSSRVKNYKMHSGQSSSVVSNFRRGIMPIEKNYFQPPKSPHSGPVTSLDTSALMASSLDCDVFELENPAWRRSMAVSESGDSLESCASISFQDLSPRTDVCLDTQLLLCESKNLEAVTDESRTSIRGFSHRNSLESRSDFDEDGSSVDPLDDLISARTVASLATEVLLKPTEEFVHAIEGSKVRRQRKLPDERNKVVQNIVDDQSTDAYSTGSELSSSRSVAVEERKIKASSNKLVKESSSVLTEKPATAKHPKTKPPTPKSCPKASPPPNYPLSTRRCFSDLDVADHAETVSENMSNVAQEGRAAGPKATVGNSVEHTRMNRTFALRCARREASDAGETPRSEALNSHQRYNRATKKNGASKFDEVQRSRSASRSRPSTTSPRSLLESHRSSDTYVSLGQRIVRKSQENDKKSHPSNIENSSSRSLSRNDESNSTVSQKSVPHHRAPNAPTKKKTKSDQGKVDAFGGPQVLAVKGNTVQSHPQSVSSSSSLPDASSNEWMRRKKYNPKQSLKAEISAKKAGKQEEQSDGKVIHDRLDQRTKNWKKAGEKNSPRSAPSTSSDWTDDEKLQLTPPGRDLPAVCQLSAKVKLLSDQVLQALRKRPEYRVNETLLQSAMQKPSDLDSLDGSSPEFLYIYHNLQAAERQMSDIYQVLASTN